MKILVIEDEPDLRSMASDVLKKEGYVVESASSFAEAVQKLSMYEYDCILLDIMLPDGDGLDILRKIASEGNAAKVIITSARNSVEDKVSGLELGADDYLPKPFHLAELVARVKSHLRRSRGGERVIVAGNVVLNPDDRTVSVNGNMIHLLGKEYMILHYFMTRPGRVVDKQAIAESVWGDNADQSDNFSYVYQQIANLKKKMKDAGADIAITAVYGFGYKLQQL